ncbi:hypothetical protein [Nocardioides pocheonensis]|uniref:Uncharacterized protein n=1 Tax=Nocardioides pocheonensis TaxID=661485 RepID=A0A3N0GN04_9ACTN|nr:hypothetical protein [Nocardioides pocheonensis]RNM13827.1 hypothetical protein EFL26_12730 [Nocardioides pocheonensis]
MSHHVIAAVRRRRTALGWAALLLAVPAVVLGNLSLASASAPVTATITVAKVYSPSIPGPSDPGGAQLVVKSVAFTVDFTTDAPLSNGGSTLVTLTVTSGPDKGLVLGSASLPGGQQSGSVVAAAGIPHAANNVGLKLTAKSPGTAPGTATVDVLKTFVSAPGSSTLTGIGGGGGAGVPCDPSPTDQTCGDLRLPSSSSATSGLLLTQGLCAGATGCNLTAGSVLQWLANLDPSVGPTNPVVFVAKCDKSLCPGKGIKTYTVSVEKSGTHDVFPSPPCAAKGVVDDVDLGFCTDYVQSTRDGAGDVLLYVLFAKDAKIIW